MKKRFLLLLLTIAMMLGAIPFGYATEDTGNTTIPIYDPEGLQAMAENPTGSYILMEDLDMTGFEWKPIDFMGSLDGNGHAILNLTLSQPGRETATVHDGNADAYEANMIGLFATMRNATVQNLDLINVRALVETEEPTFLAGITGYMDDSFILNCNVTGCLELRACNEIYAVAGVAGYGQGSIGHCDVDVTLICTDTDLTSKAEQFLGGIYAAGFIDVQECNLIIDGYTSEYGYAHTGGLVALYMQEPMGHGLSGRIMYNTVKGKITFFERNSDRRAYCGAYVGENLAIAYVRNANKEEFTRDERWDYSKELRPHYCEEPEYNETVTEGTCDTFGYTTYECAACGYTYTDHYTLHKHTVTNWTVVEAPTLESEGMSTGNCDHCDALCKRTEPMLEPEPTETEPPATEPYIPEPKKEKVNWQLPTMGGGMVFLLLTAWLMREKKKPEEEQASDIPADTEEIPEPEEQTE